VRRTTLISEAVEAMEVPREKVRGVFGRTTPMEWDLPSSGLYGFLIVSREHEVRVVDHA
jgi:hypothetical protein